MDTTEIAHAIQAIFERLGAAPHETNSKEEEVVLHNQRIRALQEAGWRFRLQLLYARSGSLGARRVGLFDTVGLAEERIYDLSGGLIMPQSKAHLALRDLNGKIPAGWGRSAYTIY